MSRDIENLTNEIEEEGNIKEAISFNSIISLLESEDPDIMETMKALPALPALLRQIHKHAYWAGADFGRLTFLKIAEDEELQETLKDELECT
jgi:hypothetical protein